MINFLLKSGILLMAVAGVIIATTFFMFTIFAFALMVPGLLLYNAGLKMGLKNIYYDVRTHNEGTEDMKTINGSRQQPASELVDKGKTALKAGVKKIRNFLNKYAD